MARPRRMCQAMIILTLLILNYIDEKVFIERVGEVYLDNFRKRIGDEVVGVDPQYFRPTEVDLLIGLFQILSL